MVGGGKVPKFMFDSTDPHKVVCYFCLCGHLKSENVDDRGVWAATTVLNLSPYTIPAKETGAKIISPENS